MNRRRVLLVGVIGILVVTAGAWMVANGGIQEVEESFENAEIPFLGDQQASQDSSVKFPPGLTGSGSLGGVMGSGGINHEEFPLTYRRALKNTNSYTYTGSWTHLDEDGDGTNELVVKKNGGKLYNKERSYLGSGDVYRIKEWYRASANDEGLYWRYKSENPSNPKPARYWRAAPYKRHQLGRELPKYGMTNTMMDTLGPVQAVLRAGNKSFTHQGTVTHQGDTVHKYTFDHIERDMPRDLFTGEHGIEDGTLESISGTVLIDQDGLVRKIEYEFKAQAGTGTGSFTLSKLGSTSNVQPSWFSEAEQKALVIENMSLVQDKGQKYLKITFSQGATVDGGTVDLHSNKGEYEIEFDESFGGGDTVYTTVVADGERAGPVFLTQDPNKVLSEPSSIYSVDGEYIHVTIWTKEHVMVLDTRFTDIPEDWRPT